MLNLNELMMHYIKIILTDYSSLSFAIQMHNFFILENF